MVLEDQGLWVRGRLKGCRVMASDVLGTYLAAINRALGRGDSTEHTHRRALQALVEAVGSKVTATNEPRRIACGAPDLAVSRRAGKMKTSRCWDGSCKMFGNCAGALGSNDVI